MTKNLSKACAGYGGVAARFHSGGGAGRRARRRTAASHDVLRHERGDRRRRQSRRSGGSRCALPEARHRGGMPPITPGMPTSARRPRTASRRSTRATESGQGRGTTRVGKPLRKGLADLNGDTLELARLGSNLFKQSALNEKGQVVNGVGDTPNTHDMLTGSQTDGRAYTDTADHTCNNWTSNSAGSAQVGHSDRTGGGNHSWNSAHATTGLQPGQSGEGGRRRLVLLFRHQLA